jgi:acetyltransferase-like isoleucine patch superfamily enzyme
MTTIAKTAIVDPTARIASDVNIQEYAIVERGCVIGERSRIGYHAVLRRGTVIGADSVFGTHSVSEGKNFIGNRTTIHSQCHITEGAVIEDQVFIAPFFVGANTQKIVHGRAYPLVLRPYRIKFGARIGIDVSVLPSIVIGREALIGAGSLVTKDIPDFSIAYGRPARVVSSVPEDERLSA